MLKRTFTESKVYNNSDNFTHPRVNAVSQAYDRYAFGRGGWSTLTDAREFPVSLKRVGGKKNNFLLR